VRKGPGTADETGVCFDRFESMFIHNAKKGLITLVFPVIAYTTDRMDYAISVRPSWTLIVVRGKSRWTQKSDRGSWFVVSS